jgi:NAD(P)-dependent dehydrogenase (short-subunit alcohol dehydrogenase family)
MTPILLTGATDGIGLATARKLAGRSLILHGRNEAKLNAVANELKQPSELADLASLADVRALVARLAKRHRKLVIINNAGVASLGGGTRSETKDGFELAWGVNFLAGFALTEGLAKAGVTLEGIVNVASAGQAPVDPKDPNLTKSWDAWRAYQQSKLAQITWSFERTKRESAPINALHPGTFLATNMVRAGGITPQGTPESGADAIDFVLTQTLSGTTGTYFNVKRPSAVHAQANDVDFQKWLTHYAFENTGV